VNTTELISALQLHGSFPTSDDLYSSADFLSLLNHQMKAEILPMMLKVNEEFFLQYQDFTIGSGSTYRIPTRAIGTVIRDLQIIDGSANVSSISRLFEEDRPNNLSGYYITRNSVELSSDFSSGTLRMKYFARPGTLVATTSCAQVTVVAGNTITVSSAPTTMALGTLVDFVQNNNPYDLLGMDLAIASVSGTTLDFAAVPSGLTVGDWICIAGESPVPMLPEEMHPVLVQSALCKTLSSKKDKAYKDELETLVRVKEDAINMLDPRIENNSNKVRSGKLLGYFSRGRR
jgi:hypothetical protein